MMQAANARNLDDFAHLRRLHHTLLRRVLAERQMGAAGVIVLANESPKQPPQMLLVHHNDVVEFAMRMHIATSRATVELVSVATAAELEEDPRLAGLG